MFILWIRKNKTGERNCPQKNDRESFPKHDEDMKKFRLAHPKIEVTSLKGIMTIDGDILAAVQNVRLSKHAQN